MAKTVPKLKPSVRKLLLTAIQARVGHFKRDEFIAKLEKADTAYHMANVRANDEKNNQSDSYSRFAELDNSLTREVAEAYEAYYTDVFLSKNKLFTMTSTESQRAQATQFNAVLANQSRRWQWHYNLLRCMQDAAKYNFTAAEVSWDTKDLFKTSIDVSAGDAQIDVSTMSWAGNHIRYIDPYNVLLDTRVPAPLLADKGEWAGWVERVSQVNLFQLVEQLKADPETRVYEDNCDGEKIDIYKVGAAHGKTNFDYKVPNVTPLGGTPGRLEIDWTTELGTTECTQSGYKADYDLITVYMRIVPKLFGLSGNKVELWKFWILEGSHILAATRVTSAHGKLPIVVGQPDVDSLGLGTSNPTQLAITHQKTAKQLLDRVLAGADRAIRDRALYDPRFIDESAINSAIPDAKIPIKVSLPPNKTIDQVYRSLGVGPDSTGLAQTSQQVYQAGLRASGVNNAMLGQFTKGNRTLEEYNDIQLNAQSRQFKRALMLEATFFANIKRILKYNILERQTQEAIYDPEAKQTVEIDPVQLHSADIEFVMADGLNPSEYMISPNVVQQLFALMQGAPDEFMRYDTGGIVAHILEQSFGIQMQQYELSEEELRAKVAQRQAAATQPN